MPSHVALPLGLLALCSFAPARESREPGALDEPRLRWQDGPDGIGHELDRRRTEPRVVARHVARHVAREVADRELELAAAAEAELATAVVEDDRDG